MKKITKDEWTRLHAVHLLNRAGFACTPEQANAVAQRRPEDSVEELLSFGATKSPPPPDWVKPGVEEREKPSDYAGMTVEERQAIQREIRRTNSLRVTQLRGWWLERMRTSSHPLQEKMTLFLHGLFATGFQKVRSAFAMYAQNQMFRTKASGHWEDIVLSVSKDPAMLIYLDNAQNRKGRPNENYARELMELFTLGEGHYTEKDIQESARAFSGWGLHPDRYEFRFYPRQHDDGEKSFLGRRGKLDGGDIVRRIVETPRAAEYLAQRLWGFFAYTEPEDEVIADLAQILRDSQMELKPALRALFLSPAFYSKRSIRTQIKSPVQWLVAASIHLGAPRIPTFLAQMMLRHLGQDLFDPPSVKGWDAGPAWITASNLLNRYNFAGVLAKGPRGIPQNIIAQLTEDRFPPQDLKKPGASQPTPRERRAAREAQLPALLTDSTVLPDAARKDKATAEAYLLDRLFQSPLREKDREALRRYLKPMPSPQKWTSNDIQNVVHFLMSTPPYQLT